MSKVKSDSAGLPAENSDERLTRRLFVVKAAAGVAVTAGGSAALAPEAAAQRGTDNDPNDAPGRGRGRRSGTDNDPTDAPGRGRPGRTDSDPNDSAGAGRSSVTDRDPTDGRGRGRGGRGSTVDRDPTD